MSDLVKRLRGHTHHPNRDPDLGCYRCEAADRIEELEASQDFCNRLMTADDATARLMQEHGQLQSRIEAGLKLTDQMEAGRRVSSDELREALGGSDDKKAQV